MKRAKHSLVDANYDCSSFVRMQPEFQGILKSQDLDEDKLYDFFKDMVSNVKNVSEDIEEKIGDLQHTANFANLTLNKELDSRNEHLENVSLAVDETMKKFQRVSESAVRIGDRLAASEAERVRLVKAVELSDLMDALEVLPEEKLLPNILELSRSELKARVDLIFKGKDWEKISHVSLTVLLGWNCITMDFHVIDWPRFRISTIYEKYSPLVSLMLR